MPLNSYVYPTHSQGDGQRAVCRSRYGLSSRKNTHTYTFIARRNPERVMPPNYETSIEHTRFLWAAVSISISSYRGRGTDLFSNSGYSQCLLLRPRRPSQHPRHRSPWPLSRRSVRPLQPKVHYEDRRNGSEADGPSSIPSLNLGTDCR